MTGKQEKLEHANYTNSPSKTMEELNLSQVSVGNKVDNKVRLPKTVPNETVSPLKRQSKPAGSCQILIHHFGGANS